MEHKRVLRPVFDGSPRRDCQKNELSFLVIEVSVNSTSVMGHVWTVPAVQEESDYQRSVRVRSCIRPVVAWRITSVAMQPLWPLALM
jgi:hypothetical protein